MATVTRPTNAPFLELDGKTVGALRSAQPASVRVEMASLPAGRETVVRRSAQVTLGEMAAEFDLPEPGLLADWVHAALAGDTSPRDGALLLVDHNLTTRRRIGFRGARLTSLAWSALDATSGKTPVTLAMGWLVDGVDDAPSGGKIPAASNRRKLALSSNFRVAGLPFGTDAVSAVELPPLQVDWAQDRFGGGRQGLPIVRHQLGELVLTIVSRQAEAARTWVHKLVADGNVDEGDGLTLQVDLLDATQKKVLASVQLTGCLLSGMDEDALGGAGSAERLPKLMLRFDVAGMKLSLG